MQARFQAAVFSLPKKEGDIFYASLRIWMAKTVEGNHRGLR